MNDLVTVEVIEEHVVLLTLNRKEAANALSSALLDALTESLQQLKKQTQLRAVMITGSGEKAFCAGADLKERKGMTNEQVVETVEKIGDTIRLVEELPVPTIAVINGVAFGGGLELALACDLRVMNSNTKVGLTETSLAIIPGAGGTQRLTRLVGLGQAKKMIFTAKPITAEKAREIGLVEEIAPLTDLMASAEELCKLIAQNAPIALRQAKKAIQEGFNTSLSSGLEIERLCYQQTIPTEDRMEGLEAFKEKRKPVYKGK
ncbi:enoyl-CoA hydratase [Halobacillus rhizosphaerae]|uniref:enoyl-CoA hydratase n=1 Tax=Halobacillus rhizosphaerae TaxID=3064889 RepID=UPI00398A69E5